VLTLLVVATPSLWLASSVSAASPPDPRSNVPIPGGGIPSSCSSQATAAACESAAVAALNAGRAALGLRPYRLPGNFASLSSAIQLFVLTNLDRVAYGETPIGGLNPSVTAEAEKGAKAGTHPSYPAGLPSGWSYNVNIDFGAPNAAFAYFFWMYEDGAGGGNSYCTKASDPNCWLHRRNLLAFPASTNLAMGAASAVDTAKLRTDATEIVDAQAPVMYDYTWAQAVAAGAGSAA